MPLLFLNGGRKDGRRADLRYFKYYLNLSSPLFTADF
jgi:hypothetical protein